MNVGLCNIVRFDFITLPHRFDILKVNVELTVRGVTEIHHIEKKL